MIMDNHDSIIDIDSCIMGKYGSSIMDIKMLWWLSMMPLWISIHKLIISITELWVSINESGISIANIWILIIALYWAIMDMQLWLLIMQLWITMIGLWISIIAVKIHDWNMNIHNCLIFCFIWTCISNLYCSPGKSKNRWLNRVHTYILTQKLITNKLYLIAKGY